ncbi:hypothetical protein K438DRAFT_1765807 [Mycena galopus ATCC 62051]|nr:hypothetical protein K438DRAFT_1765807 [Mycena galopus ATCC 62051]
MMQFFKVTQFVAIAMCALNVAAGPISTDRMNTTVSALQVGPNINLGTHIGTTSTGLFGSTFAWAAGADRCSAATLVQFGVCSCISQVTMPSTHYHLYIFRVATSATSRSPCRDCPAPSSFMAVAPRSGSTVMEVFTPTVDLLAKAWGVRDSLKLRIPAAHRIFGFSGHMGEPAAKDRIDRAAARDRGHGSTAPVPRVPCPSRRPFCHLDHGMATARVSNPTAR